MAAAGDEIPYLKEKIDFLCRLAGDDQGTAKLKQESFAAYCTIKLHRLKECLKSDNRRMSRDLQTAIADRLGFSIDEPVWFDRHAAPDAVRRDGAEAFEQMMRRRRSSALPLRFKPSAAKLLNGNLASFEVTDAKLQGASEDGILVFFEGYFETGVDNKDVYGFSRVRLAFNLGEDHESFADARLGKPDDVCLGDAKLICHGPPSHPQWYLEADKGALSGPYITGDDPLFELKHAVIDQEIVVRLSVQLRDDNINVETNGKPGGKCAKTRVLNRLRAKRHAQAEPDTDGWLDLGVQHILIVKASS